MKGHLFLSLLLVLGCLAAYREEIDDLTLRELLVKLKEKLETRQFVAREKFEEGTVEENKRFSCLTNRVQCPPDAPYCHDGSDGVGRCFKY